jgi:DNA-binding NarL/FixJ family response regulator
MGTAGGGAGDSNGDGDGDGSFTASPTRIFLVDSAPITRIGIVKVIEDASELSLVGLTAGDLPDRKHVQLLDPDLILVNSLSLPRNWREKVLLLSHRDSGPARRILSIVSDEEGSPFRGARSFADGTVLIRASPDELVAAIHLVAAGYHVTIPAPASPADARDAARQPDEEPGRDSVKTLTRREVDILRAVAKGSTNAEIAREMTLSESTVKSHVQNMLAKLGLPNRASAVAFAYDAGILARH